MINECFGLFTFLFLYNTIGMCYLVIFWLHSSEIEEFPSVHGHKCWSVAKNSPLSTQAGIQRRYWVSMRWYMYPRCWWVIVREFCGCQQHAGRWSGSKQYMDTWTSQSPHLRSVLSHCHFSLRCHML